jgi:hypothetical protein
MRIEPIIGCATLGALLFAGAATAAPPEPLVIEQLADPDATFITVGADLRSAPDEAMQSFSRAVAEATLLQQQAIQAKCSSVRAPAASAVERYAWEANCRYRRR